MAAELAAPLTRGRGTYRDYVRMLFGPNVTTLKETKTSSAITYRLTPLGVPPHIKLDTHANVLRQTSRAQRRIFDHSRLSSGRNHSHWRGHGTIKLDTYANVLRQTSPAQRRIFDHNRLNFGCSRSHWNLRGRASGSTTAHIQQEPKPSMTQMGEHGT